MSDFILEVGEPFIRLADLLISPWLSVADWFSGLSERTQHIILAVLAVLCIVALGFVEGSEVY